MKCGFKIGGGIDQDFRKSPQGYADKVWLIHCFVFIDNLKNIENCKHSSNMQSFLYVRV